MNWILRKRGDGRTFGPLDDDALRRWAWDGLIGPGDEVSDDGGSTWSRAGAADVRAILNTIVANTSEKVVLSRCRTALRKLQEIVG